MIDQLTWLYRLSDPVNVIATIGRDNVTHVSESYIKWDQAKTILYKSAKALLAKESASFDDQQETVNIINQFVDRTKDMNASYTAEVLKRLREEIYPNNSVVANCDASGRDTQSSASTATSSTGQSP